MVSTIKSIKQNEISLADVHTFLIVGSSVRFRFFYRCIMKQIPLANNKGFALIDDEDFGEISKHKWHLLTRCHNFYAITGLKINNRITTRSMHRILLEAKKGQMIDHINHNGLDNRRSNLRFCTSSQNQMNSISRIGKSKYKGIFWNKQYGKWAAEIFLNGKVHRLGRYNSEIEAAEAYDEKAKELFGEFAEPNFQKKEIKCG